MELHKMLRSRMLPALVHQRADVAAVFVLFALTVFAAWDLGRDGITVGMDAATQYYLWHSFLGESLWSGEIPGWNPHQFSGTPFAADPLSGWSYLPAMLLFTFLPLAAAANSYMFVHLLLAGLSIYALARSLGMGSAGALLAAVAYEYSSYLYLSNTCCTPHAAVMSWLPLALLGAELAIRSSRWLERTLWWGASGLALSQILAVWLGQGSYYALLTLGGYIAYRTLLFPPDDTVPGMWRRPLRSMLHGGAVLVFGFGLAAAGVLPRLEYNALSNLAGGYPSDDLEAGGWYVADWRSLLEPGYYWYAGATVLALALAAPLIARRHFAVPYFAALALCALTLSGQGPTLLHSALYLLPRFDQIHPHYPERILVIFYLGTALLAGATLSRLAKLGKTERSLAFLPVLAALFLITQIPAKETTDEAQALSGWAAQSPFLTGGGVAIPPAPLFALICSSVLVAVYALLPSRFARWRQLAPALLIMVVFIDLFAGARSTIDDQRLSAAVSSSTSGQRYVIGKMDFAEQYSPSGAARFLQSRGKEEPFRYFGYGPQYAEEGSFSSAVRFAHPNVRALEMNNRATLLGLQSTQGYDPIRIARYDEYIEALNGDEQNYHFADVLQAGTVSPLLNLLNARYIIVPANTSPENQVGFHQAVYAQYPTVYEDGLSKVLENREALPRAWIVHSARQVGSGEALELLASEEVDPKETALLEEEPPETSQPDDPSADQTSVTEYEANRIELSTSTEAPGLLVLSEIYYPAWKTYVDGDPAPIYVADHLLRSVPIPAGEHTVELRYESWTLRVGVAISLFTCAALIALAIAAGARRWRKGSGKKATTKRESA